MAGAGLMPREGAGGRGRTLVAGDPFALLSSSCGDAAWGCCGRDARAQGA